MGIAGLLPLLKSISDPVHVSSYAGTRVGIDAYAWLHRGGHQCATELALNLPTDRHLRFCIARLQLLLKHNVRPVLVFDGGRLPEKRRTEEERSVRRRKERSLGIGLYEAGQKTAAFKAFQKCVAITPVMAYQLMRLVREHEMTAVECIVAPYEADAQLAFLSLSGYVSAVISEDSDLLVFGCHRVLYKMDSAGHGEEVRLRNLGANSELSFQHWSHAQFQQMCVLAGCDYLPSLPSLGIRKAHALIRSTKQWDRAVKKLRLDGKVQVYDGYEADFQCALLCFNHQRVYCPITRRIRHLRDIADDVRAAYDSLDFLGPDMTDDVAARVANAELHPETLHEFAEADMRTVTLPPDEGVLRNLPAQAEVVSADVEVGESSGAEGVHTRVALRRQRSRGVESVSALLVKNKIDGYFVGASQASRSGFVRPRSINKSRAGRPRSLSGDAMESADTPQDGSALLDPFRVSAYGSRAEELRDDKETDVADESGVEQSRPQRDDDETRVAREDEGEREEKEEGQREQEQDWDPHDVADQHNSHNRLLTHAYSLPLRPGLLRSADPDSDGDHQLLRDVSTPDFTSPLWPSLSFSTRPDSTAGAVSAVCPLRSPSPSPSPSPPPPVSMPVFSKYFASSLAASAAHHPSPLKPAPTNETVVLDGEDEDDVQPDSSDDKENDAAAADASMRRVLAQVDEEDDIEEEDEVAFPPATPLAASLSVLFSSRTIPYARSAPSFPSSPVHRRVSLPTVRVAGVVHVRESVSAVFARFAYAGSEAAAQRPQDTAMSSTPTPSKPSAKRARSPSSTRSGKLARKSRTKTQPQQQDAPRTASKLRELGVAVAAPDEVEVVEDEGCELPGLASVAADSDSFFERFRRPSTASAGGPTAPRLPPPPLSSYARTARQFRPQRASLFSRSTL